MRILVIPEDFRKDQYILKPIFSRLMRTLGRSSAKVVVCQDPRLGGVNEALKSERLRGIIERYKGMIDLFVLCVDRDGEVNRRQRLDEIEAEFRARCGARCDFVAENAWEELETWVLAGLKLPREWEWEAVRAEVHVKEQYFDDFAERRGLAATPGGGRKRLGNEAASHVRTIRQKCPEDFDALAGRIEKHVSG